MFKISSTLLTNMLVISLAFTSLVSNIAQSAVPAAIAQAPDKKSFDADYLKKKIKASLGLEVIQVKETPVDNIALLITNQGLFYTSYQGDFFIQGKVYSLANGVVDIGEATLAKVRLEGMERFKNDMIVFPAKNEKYVVTVFTDITCGYCRKLHNQMAEYNARGITIRYLAFPRSGIKDRSGNYTKGFVDMRSVWCSDNPQEAMTKAKGDSGIPHRICDKPVEAEYNFGQQVGVNGTPAIIMPNGQMIPGYQPPDALEKVLKSL